MKDVFNDSRLYIIEKSNVDINGKLFRGNMLNISEFTLNPSNEIHLKNVYDYLKPGSAAVFYASEYSMEEVKKVNECLKNTNGYKVLLLSNNQDSTILQLDEFDLIVELSEKDNIKEYYMAERIANTIWAIMNETCVIGMNSFDYDNVLDKSVFQSHLVECDINVDNKFGEIIDKYLNESTKKILISFEGNLERLDIMEISDLLEKVQDKVDEKADVHFTVVDCKYKYDYEIIILVC